MSCVLVIYATLALFCAALFPDLAWQDLVWQLTRNFFYRSGAPVVEGGPDIRVHHEVQVALSVADLSVWALFVWTLSIEALSVNLDPVHQDPLCQPAPCLVGHCSYLPCLSGTCFFVRRDCHTRPGADSASALPWARAREGSFSLT